MKIMVWKTAILLNITPHAVYHMPMDDIQGMWKVKDGRYDQMTYEFEIDNLEKFQRKRNG